MRKKFVQTLAARQLERLGPGGFSDSGAMDPGGQSQQQQQLQEHHPPPPDGEDEIIEILDDDQEIELMMERHRKYHPRKYVNLLQPPSKIYYDKIDKLSQSTVSGGDRDDLLEDDDEQNQLVIDFVAREEATDLSSRPASASRARERERTELLYRRCATPAPTARRVLDLHANHLLVDSRHRHKDSTRVSTVGAVERWDDSLAVLRGSGGSVPIYQQGSSHVDGRIRMHPYERLVAYDRAVPPSAVRLYESGKDEQRFIRPGPPPPAEVSLRSVPSSTIEGNAGGQRRSAFSSPRDRGPNGGGAVALRSPIYYQQPSMPLHHQLFILEEWYRARGLPPPGLHANPSHLVPVPAELQSMAYYHQYLDKLAGSRATSYHQHQTMSLSPMMAAAMGPQTLQQHPSTPYHPPQFGFAKPPEHHHAPLYGAGAAGQQSHLGYPQFRPASLPDSGPPVIVTQATVPTSTTRSPSASAAVPSSIQPARFARPSVITGSTVPVILHTPPAPPLPSSRASRPVPTRPPVPPPLVSFDVAAAPVLQRPTIAQQGPPAELTISTVVSATIATTISATVPTTISATVPTTIPTTVPTTIPTTNPTTISTTIPTTIQSTTPTTIQTTTAITDPTTIQAPVAVASPQRAKDPKAASPQFKTPVSMPPRPRSAKNRKNAPNSAESIANPAQPASPSHSNTTTTTATTITAGSSSDITTTIFTAESGTSGDNTLVEHMRNEMRTFLQGRRSDIITTMRLYLDPRFEYSALLKAMQRHSITYQDFLAVAVTMLRKCGRIGFARQPPAELDYRWPAGPVQGFSQYFEQNEQCRSKAYVADYFELLVLIVDNLLQQFADPLEYFLSAYALGLRPPNHAT